MRHTVRICMAAYNTAEFIGEAFASIVRQRPDCELFLVCVDDGSDPTQSDTIRDLFVRAGFEKGHAVLKRLDSNRGLTSAWRECTNHFKECEYTTWLDSDDSYCRDDVFSDVARVADASSPDCILFKTSADEPVIDTVRKLSAGRCLYLWRKVVKTRFTPSFAGDLRIFNDLIPHYEICDSIDTVAYVARPHVNYRDSPLSMSSGRLYGSLESSRQFFKTLSEASRRYRRPFVQTDCANTVDRFSRKFLDRFKIGSCESMEGERSCSFVVPYPSVECMDAGSVVDELKLLNESCVLYGGKIDSFSVPCGSDAALDSLKSALSGSDVRFSVDLFKIMDPIGNGSSATFGMLFDSINRTLSNVTVFVPPWWRPVRLVDLSGYVNNIDASIISIELAGWPWSECGGYMNYVGRPCPLESYTAVKSNHIRDKLVFDASVPQIVNSSKFLSEFTEFFRQEQEFLKCLNTRTYYGENDTDMVLVPRDTKPYFVDVLGTNPAYRPIPKETK